MTAPSKPAAVRLRRRGWWGLQAHVRVPGRAGGAERLAWRRRRRRGKKAELPTGTGAPRRGIRPPRGSSCAALRCEIGQEASVCSLSRFEIFPLEMQGTASHFCLGFFFKLKIVIMQEAANGKGSSDKAVSQRGVCLVRGLPARQDAIGSAGLGGAPAGRSPREESPGVISLRALSRVPGPARVRLRSDPAVPSCLLRDGGRTALGTPRQVPGTCHRSGHPCWITDSFTQRT